MIALTKLILLVSVIEVHGINPKHLQCEQRTLKYMKLIVCFQDVGVGGEVESGVLYIIKECFLVQSSQKALEITQSHHLQSIFSHAG